MELGDLVAKQKIKRDISSKT